jgi:hypothetical protein
MSSNKTVYYKHRNVVFDKAEALYDFRVSVHQSVGVFIYSAVYTKRKNALLLLEKFNYPRRVLAEELQIGVDAVNITLSRISDDAYKVLGRNFADVLKYGTELELDELRAVVENYPSPLKLFEIFPAELVNSIKNGVLEKNCYKLCDCKRELTILHWYSLNKMREILLTVDGDKLGYLIRSLERPEPSVFRGIIESIVVGDYIARRVDCHDSHLYVFPPEPVEKVPVV